MHVALLLILTATATGAVGGAALAVVWRAAGDPAITAGAALAVVVAAVAADTIHARTGRLRPLSLERQVPRAWGRLFDARTAAALYGARLGIGPLTHLATWLWWAGTVLAASAGLASSVLVGATFGGARMLTVVLTSRHVTPEMPRRMAALRARERTVAPLLAAGALVSSVVMVGLA